MVMVTAENVETDCEPGISGAEDREVMKILDLMKDIELVE
jgi:hypothetical protein